MKLLFTLLLTVLLAGTVAAQQRIQTVVPVLSEQRFVLNGGMNSTFQNGKSRQVFRIQLPPNTVKWYYAFNTALPGDGGKQQLALASQLTQLIDPSGISAIAVSALLMPAGMAYADVYLMDELNARLFFAKADLNGQIFYTFPNGSRQNYAAGTVEVSQPVAGALYLGVKNPSKMSAISVSLEVAAIVEEEVPQSESQQKAALYGNLAWASYKKRDYESCITLSQKALSYDEDLPWVKCNIALCYLVMGRPEYLDSYVDAIACCKKSPRARSYLEAARKDIRTARLTSRENAEQVLQLIEMELGSY